MLRKEGEVMPSEKLHAFLNEGLNELKEKRLI